MDGGWLLLFFVIVRSYLEIENETSCFSNSKKSIFVAARLGSVNSFQGQLNEVAFSGF